MRINVFDEYANFTPSIDRRDRKLTHMQWVEDIEFWNFDMMRKRYYVTFFTPVSKRAIHEFKTK